MRLIHRRTFREKTLTTGWQFWRIRYVRSCCSDRNQHFCFPLFLVVDVLAVGGDYGLITVSYCPKNCSTTAWCVAQDVFTTTYYARIHKRHMRRMRQGRSSQWRKLRNLHRMSSLPKLAVGSPPEGAGPATKDPSPLKPPTPYGPKAEKNLLLSQVLSLQVKDAAAPSLQQAQGAEPDPQMSEDDEDMHANIWTRSVEMRAMNQRV